MLKRANSRYRVLLIGGNTTENAGQTSEATAMANITRHESTATLNALP